MRRLAKKFHFRVEVIEVDLRHGKRADLSMPAVQRKWLQLIDSGGVDALLVTPPCSTFSRAAWANDEGPYPLRSSDCPRGFTWNSGARKEKAELGNIMADFSFEAMKRQLRRKGAVAVMEQPEDLGKPATPRIPGQRPASMWQFPQHAMVAAMEEVESVALAQLDFGTESVKPTRLLLRVPGPLHPRMFPGMPSLDEEGNYMGPLPKMKGTPLIGKVGGKFRTAESASWPPQLCEWVAMQFLTAFSNSVQGAGQEQEHRQREGKKRDHEGREQGPEEKRRREGESCGDAPRMPEERREEKGEGLEEEVDPFFPPVMGGVGAARGCSWKGNVVPFHDGGCLLSPGRWDLGKRVYPEGEEWANLRARLRRIVVQKAGGEEALERECFSMARGEEGCRLVRDEGLEEAIVEELVSFCKGGDDLKGVEQGQPFRLSLMEALLKEAGDGDYEFLDEAKAGLPLGVKSQLPMTPAAFERQTEWSLVDDPTEECELSRSNYPSAAVHEDHLRSHLEAEVKEGLIEKLGVKEFEERFGPDRAVAALAVLV